MQTTGSAACARWLLVLLSAWPAVAGQAQTAAATGNPSAPVVVGRWLPPTWWSPLQSLTGDLNRDDLPDLVVLLERRREAPEDPAWPRGSRALQVLWGVQGGQYHRGPLLRDLLPCAECRGGLSGRLEAALLDLELHPDGVLELAWVRRRQETRAVRLLIGWNAEHRHLALLAEDLTIDRPDGRRQRVRRDYVAGTEWNDGEPRPLPRRFIPVEQVRAEDY